MRLLVLDEDGCFSLTKDLIKNIPPYAILSHTWGDEEEEVTFDDFIKDLGMTKSATLGYRKIQFCGEQAARDGLQYFWVDTCCINKSNYTELQEAITSMFRWYRNAAKCYVYLADVSTAGHDHLDESHWEHAFRISRWFTRGWTLQELIAPTSVEFFSSECQPLGNKKSLERRLHEITGINIEAFQGHDLSVFSIDVRFSWAAHRVTKREEDRAYSLLGIFNIYMSPRYGEGVDHAFHRLEEKIYKRASNIQLNRHGNFISLDQRGLGHSDSVMTLPHRDVGLGENDRLPSSNRAALISSRASELYPSYSTAESIDPGQYVIQFGTSLIHPADGMYGPRYTANDVENPSIGLYTQGPFASLNSQQGDQLANFTDSMRRRIKEQAMAAIIDWLDMTTFNRQYNPHQQYEKQLSLCLDGTCNWIFKTAEYLAWISDDSGDEASRVLWVCGPAGHGKSVLCARIVERFKAKHKGPMAFFFSSPHASSASASDIDFIIRSWVTQLASMDPDIIEIIQGFYKRSHVGFRASQSEIWSVFEAVLAQKRDVALFLDGYDEYPQTDDARISFLQKLKNAAAGKGTKIFITSREDSDIKAEMSPERAQIPEQVIFKCKITRDDVDNDLSLYSRSVVDRSLPNKDEGLRKMLAGQLARRCEGMFLWIKMQQLQKSKGKNKKQLEKIVGEMPRGLTETYRKKLGNHRASFCRRTRSCLRNTALDDVRLPATNHIRDFRSSCCQHSRRQ
jgi:hypothetical protein